MWLFYFIYFLPYKIVWLKPPLISTITHLLSMHCPADSVEIFMQDYLVHTHKRQYIPGSLQSYGLSPIPYGEQKDCDRSILACRAKYLCRGFNIIRYQLIINTKRNMKNKTTTKSRLKSLPFLGPAIFIFKKTQSILKVQLVIFFCNCCGFMQMSCGY